MAAAGFVVPPTFEDLPATITKVYQTLVQKGVIIEKKEVDPPVIPMDYKWATELGESGPCFNVRSTNDQLPLATVQVSSVNLLPSSPLFPTNGVKN